MKLTNERTYNILIKASVCSEWDSCNAALIENVLEQTVERWKEYDKIATDTKTNSRWNDFSHLAIYEDCTFLMERNDVTAGIPEDRSWSYVEDVTEEDLEQKPEQRVAYGIMKFFGNGEVCFVAYGKHTGEEFFTEHLNINNL
jgi:hypothetical protein